VPAGRDSCDPDSCTRSGLPAQVFWARLAGGKAENDVAIQMLDRGLLDEFYWSTNGVRAALVECTAIPIQRLPE